MIPFEDPTTLALLYHLNSEPWLNKEAYQQFPYEVEYKTIGPPDAALRLPSPPESPLQKLILERCSCRKYEKRGMPVESLSTLLFAAYGATRKMRLPDETNYLCRSIPSAGGLYPMEIYVLLQRVENVADGIYHYNVLHHALEPVKIGQVIEELGGVMLALPFIQDANVVCFLVAVFSRTQNKYGPRGYRFILLEAGHSAQNICLAATQAGLASLCIGGYLDAKLNNILHLDPIKEGVIYAVAAGYAAPDTLRQYPSARTPVPGNDSPD
jgi:SagB-type dehydrogenase family enzyme